MITPPYISQQPVDDFGLQFTDLKYNASLAVNTNTTLIIPGKAPRYKAVIKVENNGLVWVALNATATVPVNTTFSVTSSELINNANSLCREVKSGDVLHFITTTAGTDVSVVLYAVGTNN